MLRARIKLICPHLRAGKQILLQRGQRQRKKPQWLDNTIDPHMTDKKWGLPSSRQVRSCPHQLLHCVCQHLEMPMLQLTSSCKSSAPACR